MRKFMLLPAAAAAVLGLSACSTNYAGEGALLGAAGGAVVGAATEGDVAKGAAIGAAAGAVAGTLIKKDGRCYERDRYGYEYEVRC